MRDYDDDDGGVGYGSGTIYLAFSIDDVYSRTFDLPGKDRVWYV